MRKYCPGNNVTDVSGVTDHVEAVALAYCTDQPLRLTLTIPRLKISMKSFRKGAPAFPPPPNTWLMTMVGEDSGVGDGDGDDEGVGVGVGVGELEPLINTVTKLLCTPSAVTINTDLPAPRRSAGTRRLFDPVRRMKWRRLPQQPLAWR